MGRWRAGGTPSTADLTRAAAGKFGYLELDLIDTADGFLVLRHDRTVRLPTDAFGARDDSKVRFATVLVPSVPLAVLQAVAPNVSTIDEAIAVLGSRTPLLVDVKSDSGALVLANWLGQPRDVRPPIAICAPSLAALGTLRDRAPGVPRLLSLPAHQDDWHRSIAAVVRHAFRDTNVGDVAGGIVSAAGAAGRAASRTDVFGGVRWRPYIRDTLWNAAVEFGASGVSVHHWLITPALVSAAARLGLSVTAYGVNDHRHARRLIAIGVHSITSDHPHMLRARVAGPSSFARPAVALV